MYSNQLKPELEELLKAYKKMEMEYESDLSEWLIFHHLRRYIDHIQQNISLIGKVDQAVIKRTIKSYEDLEVPLGESLRLSSVYVNKKRNFNLITSAGRPFRKY